MPLHRGYERRNGKKWGYWQFGENGKRYYYTPGNNRSQKMAHTKAKKQMQAIKAHGG